MHKNQNGFSIAELIIIVVVVGAMGGAGWYVTKARDKKVEKSETTSVESSESEASQAAEETEETVELLDSEGIKVSGVMPEGWKTQKCEGNEGTLFILPQERPDVKCNSDDGGGTISLQVSTVAGSDLPKDCSQADVKRAEYEQYDWFTSYDCKTVTVDEVTGVMQITVENESSAFGASTTYNQAFRVTNLYFVSSGYIHRTDSGNSEHLTVYNEFVKSLKFQ